MLKVTEQDPYFGIVEQDLHPKKQGQWIFFIQKN